ncbi:hypothetical protein HCC36_10915 [Listeria booriae]|uniref:Uncharacterized protein n=1 Tax=Listeria booriae TaxID=1552123 RepID=A0A842G0U1_9LIST|nr:hypothetical protein [Listeria booriae]MBC2293739.1 hypothetical protein [Listeria booriae]
MTQNEKDRKIVNQALVVCKIAKANGVKDDNTIALVIELANRLLTERENAQIVYYDTDPELPANIEFWSEGRMQGYGINPTSDFKKGVWIPDVKEAQEAYE